MAFDLSSALGLISGGGGGGSSLDSLATALATAQQRAKASNPFFPVANAIANVDLHPEQMSRSSSIKNSLIQGIGAGLLQGLGGYYNEQQDKSINEGLAAMLAGQDIPDGVGSVFAPVENAYKVFQLNRNLARADAAAELQDKLSLQRQLNADDLLNKIKFEREKDKLENEWKYEGVDTPSVTTPTLTTGETSLTEPNMSIDPTLAAVISPNPTLPTTPEITRAASDAAIEEMQAPAAPAAATASSFNALMRKYGGNKAMVDAEMKAEMDKPKMLRDIEDKLAQDFQQEEAVKNWEILAPTYLNLEKAADNPGLMSDLDFVYGIAKMLDPGSVVRESEAGMVIDSRSLPIATLARLNSMLTGEGKVDRSEALALATRHVETARGGLESIKSQFGERAKSRGLTPSDSMFVYNKTPFRSDILRTIRQEATALGVDPDIAIAQAFQESGYDPNAMGALDEIGLFQLRPGTAKDMQVDPKDWKQNVKGGVKYLKQQLDKYGSIDNALYAYNAGPGNFEKGIIPSMSVDYANKILARAGKAKGFDAEAYSKKHNVTGRELAATVALLLQKQK